MHFCNICGNMFYLKISDEGADKLIHYCRKCGNKNENILENFDGDLCVSKTHIKKTQQTYKNIINEYTKLDPTLPRIKNVKCPNDSCSSNTTDVTHSTRGETKGDDPTHDKPDDNHEIIYLRYDNDNMKYIYLCTTCNHSWKNN